MGLEDSFRLKVGEANAKALEGLLEWFKIKPSFRVVTHMEFNLLPSVFEVIETIRFSMVIYDTFAVSIERSMSFYLYLELNSDLRVDLLLIETFKEVLELIEKYIEVPFDRIPLLLPIDDEIVHRDVLCQLVAYRLAVGV